MKTRGWGQQQGHPLTTLQPWKSEWGAGRKEGVLMQRLTCGGVVLACICIKKPAVPVLKCSVAACHIQLCYVCVCAGTFGPCTGV